MLPSKYNLPNIIFYDTFLRSSASAQVETNAMDGLGGKVSTKICLIRLHDFVRKTWRSANHVHVHLSRATFLLFRFNYTKQETSPGLIASLLNDMLKWVYPDAVITVDGIILQHTCTLSPREKMVSTYLAATSDPTFEGFKCYNWSTELERDFSGVVTELSFLDQIGQQVV